MLHFSIRNRAVTTASLQWSLSITTGGSAHDGTHSIISIIQSFVYKCSNSCTLFYLDQWFSNFLHQVPPQKIFGFPSTTIMTNIKMQYKWLPTAPVCVHGVCACVCSLLCVCVHFGWVKYRAQIPSMSRHFHFQ